MSKWESEDDVSLVARCVLGEERAWEALVRRYQRLLYAIVRRIGLDDHAAADVFQTVFSRLLQHLPSLREPGRLKAWIVTTTKREALRQRERGFRTVSMTVESEDGEGVSEWERPDESPLPETVLADLQMQNGVRVALERLDTRCRDLLQLLFSDDDPRQSYDAVAQRLGIPVGSIGPTRSRCLGKLRGLIE